MDWVCECMYACILACLTRSSYDINHQLNTESGSSVTIYNMDRVNDLPSYPHGYQCVICCHGDWMSVEYCHGNDEWMLISMVKNECSVVLW